MKVLLVAPPIMDIVDGSLVPIAMDARQQCPPYGIYLLAGILRSCNHDVIIADLISDGSNSLSTYNADVHDAGLVGISATTMSWPTAIDVIQQIRSVSDSVPIVLGGIHPTMFDKHILTNFPVDYVVRGEGENAIKSLVQQVEQSGDMTLVPNLSWKDKDGNIVRNHIASKLTADQLVSQPLPAYDLLQTGIYSGLSIESSRGCAFDCSFCSTSYRKSYRGFPARQFVDRLESINSFAKNTRHRTIHIVDDEFSLNWRRAADIATNISDRGLKPKLIYDSRANELVRDEYLETIAPYTYRFLVGAECGYDEGLVKIGKGTTCDLLKQAAEKLAKYDIADRADFSFILGLPWESIKEVERTLRFAFMLHGRFGVRTAIPALKISSLISTA